MGFHENSSNPDGNIKVGMGRDCPWREERLGNALRLIGGCRQAGIPVVHVRLAVRPDYADVTANTPIIREWIEANAWREGTWGTEFLEGFEPFEVEIGIKPTTKKVKSFSETISWTQVLSEGV